MQKIALFNAVQIKTNYMTDKCIIRIIQPKGPYVSHKLDNPAKCYKQQNAFNIILFNEPKSAHTSDI
uniref:Uncharacterized protein n=1 Tax=Rhizophora mucronata TaxID=61149 RepID=A0A2P2L1T7_RHIMU